MELGFSIPIANSPYACLRQTSKFHHQVSFSKYKVAKFCINEFPGQYSWKEYPRIKSANAKNFAFKRGLVVKFARLTQSRIRAIGVRIVWAVLRTPKRRIPDSTCKFFPDSGFHYMRCYKGWTIRKLKGLGWIFGRSMKVFFLPLRWKSIFPPRTAFLIMLRVEIFSY